MLPHLTERAVPLARPPPRACVAGSWRLRRPVSAPGGCLAAPADARRASLLPAAAAPGDGGAGNPDGQRLATSAAAAPSAALVNPPVSMLDVDSELWEVLDLCSDEELDTLYSILHSASPFSPLLKSVISEREPALLEARGRTSVMHKIEARFRFLAADSGSVLRGRRPAYREALLSVRDQLGVTCSGNLGTCDLETEIFVHLLHNCAEYVEAAAVGAASEGGGGSALTVGGGGGSSDSASDHSDVLEGDGMTAALPLQDAVRNVSGGSSSGSSSGRVGGWLERISAPFALGARELAPAVVKLGGALTVSGLGRQAVQELGGRLVAQHLRYQAAMRAAGAAAGGAAGSWKAAAALSSAVKGVTAATARYSAVRGALSLLGPLLWGSLALDLALVALGTDYARVTRAVFLLAQVRLTRTGGFVNPPTAAAAGANLPPL